MDKLSVVVITKNEEDSIRKCLDSLRNFANEIIVVDDKSTDQTVHIVQNEYNAKVIINESKGNFDKQRNLGIEAATCEWILQMDADEIVTDSLKKDIENVLEDDRGFSAFKFRRKNYFLGHFMKHGGWYHYSLNFFKKGKARYKGKVHEALIVNGKIGKLEGDCEHYPFNSLSEFIARHNRYADIEAQKILDTQGVVSKKTIMYNLKIKPFKRFWKFYVKKKGFLEGRYGLIFSVLFAWVHFINWAKYWELVKEKYEE